MDSESHSCTFCCLRVTTPLSLPVHLKAIKSSLTMHQALKHWDLLLSSMYLTRSSHEGEERHIVDGNSNQDSVPHNVPIGTHTPQCLPKSSPTGRLRVCSLISTHLCCSMPRMELTLIPSLTPVQCFPLCHASAQVSLVHRC